ncbi:putative aminophospholipid-translocase [Zalaria obscura]|uniref:Aminophospholipid-translocase n=1 Tax=Zalaria obscura TaxID=2024903 RepID=A0ACC3SB09_9PEZI
MSIPHEYHRPDSPASLNNDHDSDLDLDLDELDPTTSLQARPSGATKKGGRKSYEFGGNIPLRNLRLGGVRGYKRAARRQDAEAEDLEALVDGHGSDDPSKRESAASSGIGDDDAPLLRSGGGLRRLSQQSQSALSRFKAKFIKSHNIPSEHHDDPNDPDTEEHDPSTNRTISVGQRQASRFPPNAVSNAKYTPVSFLPRTLYNEFSFFFNMYFLLVALSQVIPALRIGYLSTYIVPLAFVLAITLGKEAMDDVARRRRDQEANAERYEVLDFQEPGSMASQRPVNQDTPASKNQKSKRRRKSASSGHPEVAAAEEGDEGRPSSSVREISKPSRDLKVGDVLVMRKDQRFPADVVILKSFSNETANTGDAEGLPESQEAPENSLIEMDGDGTVATAAAAPLVNETTSEDPSAGGEAFIRTDQLDGETDWKLRLASPLAQDLPREEFKRLRVTAGKPDKKVNEFVGKLELLPLQSKRYDQRLSMEGEEGSMSVPLSIDNTAWANTVLASSSTVLASSDGPTKLFTPSANYGAALASGTRTRREIGLRVRDLVLALGLCHNVTPTTETVDGQTVTSYQASSPDEIAIVQWTEHVGLRVLHRDRKSITLQYVGNDRIVVRVKILNIFPFTSDSKRMGIIVRFLKDTQSSQATESNEDEIYFYQKGADTVMTSIVAANDWLDEETGNMAREGLRTLVIGRKALSSQQYSAFYSAYSEASLSLGNRDSAMARVVNQHLEHDLELLGVTGVEDKLQASIKPSLELLRNAGIKIWMLTGDKVETARCVAVSSKLVARGQYIHTIAGLRRKEAALDALSLLNSQPNACLLIDGQSLSLYLTHHREVFISLAVRLPTVIACRCSPTQKADIARLIRTHTRKRIACIGDGGNDVSMIQAADVGVGIVVCASDKAARVAWPQQLQAQRQARAICHPPRSHHQCLPDCVQRRESLRADCAVQGLAACRIRHALYHGACVQLGAR